MHNFKMCLRLLLGSWLLLEFGSLHSCESASAQAVSAQVGAAVVEQFCRGIEITEEPMAYVMMHVLQPTFQNSSRHSLIPVVCKKIIREQGGHNILHDLLRNFTLELRKQYVDRIEQECQRYAQALADVDQDPKSLVAPEESLNLVTSFIAQYITKLYLKAGLHSDTDYWHLHFLSVAIWKQVQEDGIHTALMKIKQDLDTCSFANADRFLTYYQAYVGLYIPPNTTAADLVLYTAVIDHRVRAVSLSDFLAHVEYDRVSNQVRSELGRGIVSDVLMAKVMQECKLDHGCCNPDEIANWFAHISIAPEQARSLQFDGRLGRVSPDLYKAAKFLVSDFAVQDLDPKIAAQRLDMIYQTLCCAYSNYVFGKQQDILFRQVLHRLCMAHDARFALLLREQMDAIMQSPENFKIIMMGFFDASMSKKSLGARSDKERQAYCLQQLLCDGPVQNSLDLLRMYLFPVACLDVLDKYPNNSIRNFIEPRFWFSLGKKLYRLVWKKGIDERVGQLIELYNRNGFQPDPDSKPIDTEYTNMFFGEILNNFSISQIRQMLRDDESRAVLSWETGSPLYKALHSYAFLRFATGRLPNLQIKETDEQEAQQLIPEEVAAVYTVRDPEHISFATVVMALSGVKESKLLNHGFNRIADFCADVNSGQDKWTKSEFFNLFWALYEDKQSGFKQHLELLLSQDDDLIGLTLGFRNFMTSFHRIRQSETRRLKSSCNEGVAQKVKAWQKLDLVSDKNWVNTLPDLPASAQASIQASWPLVVQHKNLVKIAYKLLQHMGVTSKTHGSILIRQSILAILTEFLDVIRHNPAMEPSLHCAMHTLMKAKDAGLSAYLNTVIQTVQKISASEWGSDKDTVQMSFSDQSGEFLAALPGWVLDIHLSSIVASELSKVLATTPVGQTDPLEVKSAAPAVDEETLALRRIQSRGDRQRARELKERQKAKKEKLEVDAVERKAKELEEEVVRNAILDEALSEVNAIYAPNLETLYKYIRGKLFGTYLYNLQRQYVRGQEGALQAQVAREESERQVMLAENMQREQQARLKEEIEQKLQALQEKKGEAALLLTQYVSSSDAEHKKVLQTVLLELDPKYTASYLAWMLARIHDLQTRHEAVQPGNVQVPEIENDEVSKIQPVVVLSPTVAKVVTAAKPASATAKKVSSPSSQPPKSSTAQGSSRNQQAPVVSNPKKVVGAALASDVAGVTHKPTSRYIPAVPKPKSQSRSQEMMPTVAAVVPAPLPVDELSTQTALPVVVDNSGLLSVRVPVVTLADAAPVSSATEVILQEPLKREDTQDASSNQSASAVVFASAQVVPSRRPQPSQRVAVQKFSNRSPGVAVEVPPPAFRTIIGADSVHTSNNRRFNGASLHQEAQAASLVPLPSWMLFHPMPGYVESAALRTPTLSDSVVPPASLAVNEASEPTVVRWHHNPYEISCLPYVDAEGRAMLSQPMNSEFPWNGKADDFDNFQASIKPNGFDGSGIFGR